MNEASYEKLNLKLTFSIQVSTIFAARNQSVIRHLCRNESGGGQAKAHCRAEGIQKGTFNKLAGKFRLFLCPQVSFLPIASVIPLKIKNRIFLECDSKIIGFFWSASPKISQKRFIFAKKCAMYIRRNIHEKLSKHLPKKEFTIITGARQTGKTSLLRELFNSEKEQNEHTFFISFENLEVLQNINEHPENLFKFVARPTLTGIANSEKGRVSVFIDEVQYAQNPSNFLKYLFDHYQENLKIVATGSSAFYIDSNFDDSLAGRKRIFTLRTLSFDEYLIFSGHHDLVPELEYLRNQHDYLSARKNEIMEIFSEYLIFGGYPAVALEEDNDEKIELLKDIKNSFLKRDIDESGVTKQDAFLKMFALLADQTGNLLNKNELSNTIGIDNKTIDNYLHVLQKCFHIALLKPFSTNLRKELTKMPKVFFFDNGMRNVMLNRFSQLEERSDRGALLENWVFNRLNEINDPDHIRYWRTNDQKEVDFVITADYRTGKAFEVKMDSTHGKTNSLKRFKTLYPAFETELVTYSFSNSSRQALKL